MNQKLDIFQSMMRREKKVAVFAAALVLLAVVLLAFRYGTESRIFSDGRSVVIDGKEYALEVADTEEKREKGLGDRDALCPSCAMLFVFDHPARYTFWMKGMRFPLDIVWLSGNRIIHIERSIAADSENLYTPDQEADRVLEFNAGAMKDISVGAEAEFSR